jgi:hypothetical protein
MATILDLFKSQKSSIYGQLDNIRIESRGLINPPRGAALLASSPNALADLIGGQIGGALGGTANRPSDTVFRNDSFLAKPISLFKTPQSLRNAIDADTSYYVKRSPSPESIFNKIKQGSSSPLGVAANIGFGLLKGLKDRNPTRDNPYGAKYSTTFDGKTINETKTFSNFYQTNTAKKNKSGKLEWVGGQIKKRDDNPNLKGKSFDIINENILNAYNNTGSENFTDEEFEKFKEKNTLNIPYVYIQTYEKKDSGILLPGTISGISEEITPQINEFKYVGSPFSVYKYGGVARTLKFELKLYHYDIMTLIGMKKNLNKLRKLVFPDENISVNTYNNSTQASPMLYNPNLVYLTINGLYDNLFGIIDSLSINIEETTSWGANDIGNPLYTPKTQAAEFYPSVISVSFGMKIIENPSIKDDKYYVYTFSKGKKLQAKVAVAPPMPMTKNGYEEEDNRPI